MKPKFTAGEWEVYERAGSTFVYGELHTAIDHEGKEIEGRHLIATVNHIKKEETAANAALIAAAPAMLAVLLECIQIYEEVRDAQPTGHLWPDPNHIFHARNAIKNLL